MDILCVLSGASADTRNYPLAHAAVKKIYLIAHLALHDCLYSEGPFISE